MPARPTPARAPARRAGGILDGDESCGGDVRPIAVVGSLNVDLVVRVGRLPAPGETVLGKDLVRLGGGKGGNQAVAAARLGGRVEMVAKVGQDEAGSALIASLDEAGIDIGLVLRDASSPTGTAIVIVEEGGANTVTVVPGANGSLSVADVDQWARTLTQAPVLVLQLEVPLETVIHAAEVGREHGATVILNAAPAAAFSERLHANIDMLVVNEFEAQALALSYSGDAARSMESCAREWLEAGVKAVIVTQGSAETLLFAADRADRLLPPAAEPVDTTGAGDAFVGAFALAVACGLELQESVAVANAAAALSVTSLGAQQSMPGAESLAAFAPSAWTPLVARLSAERPDAQTTG
jgi:ribokinase